MKPFLVVNGRSLLLSAVESALAENIDRVVVVASPQNVQQVWDLVGDIDDVRVTVSDRGVGDSVYRGAELTVGQRLLVLMSDNVFGPGDIANVIDASEYGIGVRDLPEIEARRFTRLGPSGWFEDPRVVLHESTSTVWCGPIVILRSRAYTLRDEPRMGAHLNSLVPGGRFTLVHTTTDDVGTPEAITRLTGGSR